MRARWQLFEDPYPANVAESADHRVSSRATDGVAMPAAQLPSEASTLLRTNQDSVDGAA